jgi:AhpD family alkylhydroperoxidase
MAEVIAATRKGYDMANLYDSDDLKKLPKLGAGAPAAWKGFLDFDKAAFADGAIPIKYKELMALAVALTTQCPYCLLIHKEKALKAGATAEEISETAFIAAAMRAGAAVTHATHLVD